MKKHITDKYEKLAQKVINDLATKEEVKAYKDYIDNWNLQVEMGSMPHLNGTN